MARRTTVTRGIAVGLLGLLATWGAAAEAQENRLRVSFGAAATTGLGDTQPAWSGSAGYKFSNRLVFDGEVTYVAFDGPRLDGPIAVPLGVDLGQFGMQIVDTRGQVRTALGPAFNNQNLRVIDTSIFPPVRASIDGNTMIGTVGLRYEFPVDTGRLMPYVSAGLGMARTERSFEYSIAASQGGVVRGLAGAGLRGGFETVTNAGFAASFGVGANVRVYKQLSVDVDARYFRLDNDRDLARLGGGVSYRF